MAKCFFCSSECESYPPSGAYYYIACKKCGEYKITIPSTVELNNEIVKNNLHVLAADVFWNNRTVSEELIIKTEYLLNNDYNNKNKLINKTYYLARYIFEETKKVGLGAKVEGFVPQCCYAKNSEEVYSILAYLKELSIVSYWKNDRYSANGFAVGIIGDIKMKAKAYGIFENGISSVKEFESAFRGINMEIPNILIDNKNGNVVLGNNNNVNTEISGITESSIVKELLLRNIDLDQIDKIRSEIKELSLEISSNRNDIEKITNIFSKIKAVGGKVLLTAFSFITKPEVIGVIDRLIQ